MNSHPLLPQEGGQPLASHAPIGMPAPNAPLCAHSEPAPHPADLRERLLIVDDDIPLARLLCSWLQTEGFAADLAHDGEEALAKLREHSYRLLLLDLNLPKIDGLALLHEMHGDAMDVAVMVLTGRGKTEDLVSALNGGADDCVLKPFSLMELAARIRAVLRRRVVVSMDVAVKQQPGLSLNREEYRVEPDGRRIELTPREFTLLEYLMEQAPRPVSRATLMEKVWQVPFDPTTNIVDVYMKYLRDKIDCAGEQKLIRTVRGVGYALACA